MSCRLVSLHAVKEHIGKLYARHLPTTVRARYRYAFTCMRMRLRMHSLAVFDWPIAGSHLYSEHDVPDAVGVGVGVNDKGTGATASKNAHLTWPAGPAGPARLSGQPARVCEPTGGQTCRRAGRQTEWPVCYALDRSLSTPRAAQSVRVV